MTNEVDVEAVPGFVVQAEPENPPVKFTVQDMDQDYRDTQLVGLPYDKELVRFEVWHRARTQQSTSKWTPISQWDTEQRATDAIEKHGNEVLVQIPYPVVYEYLIVKAVAQRELWLDSFVMATRFQQPA